MLRTSNRFIMLLDSTINPVERSIPEGGQIRKVSLEREFEWGKKFLLSFDTSRGRRRGRDIAYPFRSSDSRLYRYLGIASRIGWEALLRLLSLSLGTCRFYRSKPFHPLVRRFYSRITPPRPSLNGTHPPDSFRVHSLFIGSSKVVRIIRDYIFENCRDFLASDRRVAFDVNDCSSNLDVSIFRNIIIRCIRK